ncbi:YslB family protein [Alteribacillus sp. YIM 98480]|uniref:YslB family protein n=1 Tax=Alteribacillus sp. YIM 98480 TaxID=2606599 RepID=UPI00131B496C|nr:YslB family protein [Alteribacillus sp. YIM 98480]
MEENENNYASFSYTLLRNTLIPELLGKEEADIMYWGGKTIARKYPAEDLQDIVSFFNQAGWGELKITKEKRREYHFDFILPPTTEHQSIDRHLEAGFLAEQIENLKGKTAETYIIEKRKHITFEVHWDR